MLGEKNAQLLSYLIAVLNSENAYLPLNPDWPIERIAFIIQRCSLQACIIEDKFRNVLYDILEELKVKFTIHPIEANYSFVKIAFKQHKFPKDLAYILFTSGSTGFPKGIGHGSDSISTFLKWCTAEFDKYMTKRFVSIAPLNFDLSVFDVFYPFIKGQQLCLPSGTTLSNTRLFIQYVVKNKIEVIYTTPSYLKLLLQTAQLHKYNLSFVKLILIAGEQLRYDIVINLKTHFTKAVFYNLYGPTETNVCTFYKIEFNKPISDYVPIGKPCLKSKIQTGKNGELLYKGKLLMKTFITEKGIYKVNQSTYFKTGDLVKREKDGNYVFIERKDTMVKRNGFRIELNEIKKVLTGHGGAGNCEVCVLKKDAPEIIAFVEANNLVTELNLKNYCLQKLPSYMLPDRIVVVDKFPLTLNHKTDIKKLLENFS